MFLAVIKVQALASVGKAVSHCIPNPDGAVGDDQHLFGLAQAADQGLVVELPDERLDSGPSDGIATLADKSSAAGGLGAMIQTEDGAHVNPVPTGDRLAFGAQFFGLSPVIALA